MINKPKPFLQGVLDYNGAQIDAGQGSRQLQKKLLPANTIIIKHYM